MCSSFYAMEGEGGGGKRQLRYLEIPIWEIVRTGSFHGRFFLEVEISDIFLGKYLT